MEYYSTHEPSLTVNVLGMEYAIYLDVPEDEDLMLKVCDGYCDKTSHKIVVVSKQASSDLDDFEFYRKKVLRHELIHAFMFESGLSGNTNWVLEGEEHPEMVVDWMAWQFPKMAKAFQQVEAL